MADDPKDSVVEKTTTEKASGQAALVQPSPPAPAADDYIRKVIVVIDMVQFGIIIGGISAFLIYANLQKITISTDVLAVLIMVIQAEIGFIIIERQYLFGSSSGSTAKDKRL